MQNWLFYILYKWDLSTESNKNKQILEEYWFLRKMFILH